MIFKRYPTLPSLSPHLQHGNNNKSQHLKWARHILMALWIWSDITKILLTILTNIIITAEETGGPSGRFEWSVSRVLDCSFMFSSFSILISQCLHKDQIQLTLEQHGRVRGTHPLHSQKPAYNFTVSSPYLRFHICRSTIWGSGSCNTTVHIYWKKYTYKWTHAVQTHVVRGSILF